MLEFIPVISRKKSMIKQNLAGGAARDLDFPNPGGRP